MHRFASVPALIGGVAIVLYSGQLDGQSARERAIVPLDTTEQHAHFPAGRHELAVEGALGYYTPEPGFYQLYRDIDVTTADVAVAAHMPAGWEFLADAFVLRAQYRTPAQVFVANPPSNALALGGGPGIRWNLLEVRRARIFVDARGDLLFANHPFPAGGTSPDLLLRAAAGAA